MGKTFKRNQQYRPKKGGKVFNKDDKSWKKNKKPKVDPVIVVAPPPEWDSTSSTPDYT